MPRGLILTSLRYLLRHPWQVGLSILGVALGVAVVIAIDLANGSARAAFQLSTETVTGRATHQIVGAAQGLDETLYRELLLRGLGVPLAPVVEGYAQAADRQLGTLRIFGIDPFAETAFRSLLGGAQSGDDLTPLLAEPATTLISTQTAQRAGLGVGDELPIVVDGERKALRIVGILEPQDDASRRGLDGLLIMDIATAQETLGRVGRLSRIDLLLPEGAAGEALAQRLAAWLPPGVTLERAAARTQSVEQLGRAFEVNLTALSLLALVVGMFLIYNTATFSVVQRRGLLGTLRCLGVSRREIFALILVEAALLGAIGSALGVLLGIALGRGLVTLVTRTINDLYFVVTVRSLYITAPTLGKGLLLGLGATVITAALPAYEASTTPPRTVLRRSSAEERIRRALPRVSLLGLLLLVAGGGLLALPSRSLVVSFSGLFGLIFGCALLTPLATLALMTLLRPPGGWAFGLLGRMAPRGVIAALSRTSVAIAALMIAVSVTVGVGIMVGSFRQTVITWLETSLQADIYISSPGLAANRPDAALDPRVAEVACALPEVAACTRNRNILARTADGQPVIVVGVDAPPEPPPAYRLVAGALPAAWQAVQQGNAVLVSEPLAYRLGLPRTGGSVTLVTDQGPQRLAVAGIFYDYSSDQGVVIMPLARYRQFWNDAAISSVALMLQPGTDVDRSVERLRAQVGGLQELLIRSNRGLREETLRVFDRTFAITAVLQLLATLIAFVGILSALMALQLERARELGVMRANGLTPRQLWGVVLGQTGLMGLTAGLLALPVGVLVALVLVHVINKRSFGWSLQVIFTPGVFVQALALAILAALLAGIYPSYRMARTSPAVALREE
ncbi:FtsX-like permease family protein [Kallotenue papyrolyticum]|uniref:FtsX-like permease family protein n=1 Tax=Kallotenue papyrolyticum TaxID=1325125 RepID=UPI0004928526|nr:FtsX-like permease family protein [Kallotenue papyrolyticum]